MTDLEIMCHMRQYANSATNTHIQSNLY